MCPARAVTPVGIGLEELIILVSTLLHACVLARRLIPGDDTRDALQAQAFTGDSQPRYHALPPAHPNSNCLRMYITTKTDQFLGNQEASYDLDCQVYVLVCPTVDGIPHTPPYLSRCIHIVRLSR